MDTNLINILLITFSLNYTMFTFFFWFLMNQSTRIMSQVVKNSNIRSRKKQETGVNPAVRELTKQGAKRPYLWPYYVTKILLATRNKK